MTTYRITSNYFVAAIIRDGDLVVQAAPVLGWTVRREWQQVLTYFNQRGWVVEPLIEEPPNKVTNVSIDDEDFEIHYSHNQITRVTRSVDGDSVDLTHNELPELLKTLLS
jgi:hypothetical protein